MIPQTSEQWMDCIVNHCAIPLTKDFARTRLAIYRDKNNPETKKFLALYGEHHLENIIEWLNQV